MRWLTKKPCLWACVGLSIIGSIVYAQGLTLDQALEAARKHNPDLRRARAIVQAENALIWEHISPDYPELFAEVEGVPGGRSWEYYGARKMGIKQSFDFPLSYVIRGQSRHWKVRQAEAQCTLQRIMLDRDVKKAYARILQFEEQVRLQEDIARITRDMANKARIRVLAGESSPYDTLKVNVELAAVENRLIALEADVRVARSELALLMDRKQELSELLTGELKYSPLSVQPESLKEKALSGHPKIMAAQAHAHSRNAEKRLAWLDLLPAFHMKYFQHDMADVSSADHWGGEIGLQVPLWIFFKGQGKIRAAHYRGRASGLTLLSVRNQVVLGVERSWSALMVAEKQVKNYRENTLIEVAELVRIATRSYAEGEMSTLEVGEALKVMGRIKSGYVDALYYYNAAMADLEAAAGSVLQ